MKSKSVCVPVRTCKSGIQSKAYGERVKALGPDMWGSGVYWGYRRLLFAIRHAGGPIHRDEGHSDEGAPLVFPVENVDIHTGIRNKRVDD